jgi:hypothetical protein
MSYKYVACLASSKAGSPDPRCVPDENWSQYFQRRLPHCSLPKSEKGAQISSDESGSAGLGPLLSLLFDENNPEQQEVNCRDAVQLAHHLIIVGSALFACSHFVADLVHSFLSYIRYSRRRNLESLGDVPRKEPTGGKTLGSIPQRLPVFK